MIIKPKKMSVRKNQSREENEQLNSFKENLFGNLKESLNIKMYLDPVPYTSVPRVLTVRTSESVDPPPGGYISG